MIVLLFLGALLLILLLAPFVGYRLAGRSRYRSALRGGLCTAALEFWVLECFDNKTLHLGPIYFDNGLQYLAEFLDGTVRWADLVNGKRPDLLVLLLIPILATFIGFKLDQRRLQPARI